MNERKQSLQPTVLAAAHTVLFDNGGQALHYDEISRRIVERGILVGHGKAFPRTVYSRMSEDIKRNGELSRFVRVGKGFYGLRST